MNQPCPDSQSFSQLYPLSNLPELSSSRQISAEHFLSLGNRHYNDYLSRSIKRELDMAITHYKQALDMNPALPEAHVKLASALWDRGAISLEMAIEYCETSLSLNPGFSEAYLFKGYFLRKSGRLDEAVFSFRQAIEKAASGESTARARMALGQTLLQSASHAAGLQSAAQRIGQAFSGLRQWGFGLGLLPTDKKAFPVIQNALMADLKIFSVLGTGKFLKTFGLGGLTASLYNWGTRKMPEEPIFHHLLGDMQAERDNLDGALYFYNRAKELDPDNTQVHKKLGHVYRECNDSANAARSLEKVVEASEADFDTLYALAQIYSDNAEYIRALYYYKELLNQQPDSPYILSNMAYVLFKLGDYDGAIEQYQTAVKFGKDPVWTATVAQTLGTIYYQIKQDLDTAADVFQLAAQLNPADLECLTMLGDIYTEQGNFEAAIRIYRDILDREPDNAECYNYLGYLLWQLDKNDEAVNAYGKALALNPDNPIAYNNLGVIYLDEKCQLQTALEMFQKAFDLKADYTLACFNVARTREALGQTAEAAKGYTLALQLNSDNQELNTDEIQERLDNLFQV